MFNSQATYDRLKEHIEDQLQQRDRLYQQFLESNEKRLEGLNGFRQAMNDAALRNITRTEHEADLGPIREKLNNVGKANWTLIGVVASMIAGLVTSVWLVIGLQIQAAETPTALSVSQIKEGNAARDRQIADLSTLVNHADQVATQGAQQGNATSALLNANADRLRVVEQYAASSGQADSQSKTDRQQLNERLRIVENLLNQSNAEERTKLAVIEAKLIEIETQFCGSDVARNLTHANDLRMQSMLWRKAFPDAPFPTDNAYYPKTCNR